MSQEQFAFDVGLARSYIGGVERGERNISFVNLARIVGFLDVTWQELLDGVPPIFSDSSRNYQVKQDTTSRKIAE